MRLNLILQVTADFDKIQKNRTNDSTPAAYPSYEVNEMLKHTLQHSDQDIRQVSQKILNLNYEKNGFSGIEPLLMQLHPQTL